MAIIRKTLKSTDTEVNLCQKLFFLHQPTHNMMNDCSLFMKIVSSEYLQNMLCTNCCFCFVLTFRTILVHNKFCRCCELLKKIYLYYILFPFAWIEAYFLELNDNEYCRVNQYLLTKGEIVGEVAH